MKTKWTLTTFRILFLLGTILLTLSEVKAQHPAIDSLKAVLNDLPVSEKQRMYDIQLDLASKLNSLKNKDALLYAEKAIATAQDLNSQKLENRARFEKAHFTCNYGAPKDAFALLDETLEAAEELKDTFALKRIYQQSSYYNTFSGNTAKGISFAIKAEEIATEFSGKNMALQALITAYSMNQEINKAAEYSEKGLALAQQYGEPRDISYMLSSLGKFKYQLGEVDEGVKYLEEAVTHGEKNGIQQGVAYAAFDLGQIYWDVKKEYPQAKEYFQKAYDIGLKIGDAQLLNGVAIGLGNAKLYLEEEEEGYELLANAYKESIAKNNYLYAAQQAQMLYTYFNYTKNADSLIVWTQKMAAAKDSLNNQNRQKTYKEVEAKYEVGKTKEENAQLQDDITSLTEQQRKTIIAAVTVALILCLIIFLVYKNFKRKQLLIETEKELEKQKISEQLKAQELAAIDAILLGQEQERKKTAKDLHDGVGSNLAAAKMQFSHLKLNHEKISNLEEVFEKTESLLNDAYEEVRNIAHSKNTGVLAQKGLLPAIEKLAVNMSQKNQLQIELAEFGLEERLDNTTEINIYRVLQELITNIIKHAQASRATISITRHEEGINIIVEDDGKGFPSNQNTQDGMGLNSVDNRVKKLNGDFHIDSSQGKGTSIIIDIPLAS